MLPRPRVLPSGFIAPCLPTKAERPPSGEMWLHEIKHHATASPSMMQHRGAIWRRSRRLRQSGRWDHCPADCRAAPWRRPYETDRLPTCVQARPRRHRLEAEVFALPQRPISRLAQIEEPGLRGCEAGGGGGLGTV